MEDVQRSTAEEIFDRLQELKVAAEELKPQMNRHQRRAAESVAKRTKKKNIKQRIKRKQDVSL